MDESRKAAIVSTLSTLVDNLIEHRKKSSGPPSEFRAISFRELADQPAEAAIATNPVVYSLRLGIKHLGRIVASEGGFDLMQEISDRVDSLPQYVNTSRPAVIIDHAWDGIGGWYA